MASIVLIRTEENERLTCTRDLRADMYRYQYFSKSISMVYPRNRLVQTFPHAQNDQRIRAHLFANKRYFVIRCCTPRNRPVWIFPDMQND